MQKNDNFNKKGLGEVYTTPNFCYTYHEKLYRIVTGGSMKKYILFIFTMFICFTSGVDAVTKYQVAQVNATELMIRTSAAGSSVMKDVDNQTVYLDRPKYVEILDNTTVNGQIWYKIFVNYYSNNYTGWVSGKYLNNFKTYDLDDSYAQNLRNKGFPDTYILPLQKLHALYPNYQFNVSKYGNGLNFQDVINGEYSPLSKNLISGPNTTIRSTDGGAYSNGVYVQFEPGWYAPSKQTLSFYIDPRNWINPYTVFMFEQLSFNENENESSVQKLLNGTFMSGSFNYNGSNKTYASTFVETGRANNVSPFHLASRAIQEQGASGSGTINMVSGGVTYHNFFNINATGSTTSAIIANALNYAKSKGWTNPYLSINGGAAFLANGYINAGQDTVYYQKFNTINSSLYWHQYMANVRAPISEAYSMYRAKDKAGLLNNGFTFKIPVYNNMPAATTLSTSANGDNSLKSLNVSNCSLSPAFDSGVVNYSCSVSENIRNVNVSGTNASSYSSTTGFGTYNLSDGLNKISVVVTAANGATKTYTINVTKLSKQDTEAQNSANPNDIVSAVGLSINNSNVTGINPNTERTSLINNIRNRYSLAVVTIKDITGKVQTSSLLGTGDTITITNGNTTKSYTLIIKGDTNNDGKINITDYARVKRKILGETTLNDVYNLASDVNKDGKVNITDYSIIKRSIQGETRINQ